jgi:hypothetical protein
MSDLDENELRQAILDRGTLQMHHPGAPELPYASTKEQAASLRRAAAKYDCICPPCTCAPREVIAELYGAHGDGCPARTPRPDCPAGHQRVAFPHA